MKTPTAEQKAKAKERRERFRVLVRQVASMTDIERASLTSRLGAVPTCDGHTLSLHNTCLLITQCPTVSLVGGFRQWLKVGRAVRKGEHGHCIWIPLGKPANGEPIDPVVENDTRFGVGTVFDIAQTDELPPTEEQPFDVIDALAGIGKLSLRSARGSGFRPPGSEDSQSRPCPMKYKI